MVNTLLVATTNVGKLAEVREILSDFDYEIISLDNISWVSISEVAETGSSFLENALQKAQSFATQTNLPTLAEDSGLVVTALNGEPGVFSARWHPGSDADRCQALLTRMEGITDRSAQFVCVACLYNPVTKAYHCFTGVVEGSIALEMDGVAGFGYDPIFIPKGKTQTFATLGQMIKNSLSHRHNALKLMQQYLQKHPRFLDL